MKKKMLFVIVLVSLLLTACGNPKYTCSTESNWIGWAKSWVNAGQTHPTNANLICQENGKFELASTIAPAPASAPAAEPQAPPTGTCAKHGQIAYQDGNDSTQAGVIGGAYEECAIIGEIHGTDGKGYVIVLQPKSWIRLDFIGGTGWYVNPNEGAITWSINNSINGITARGEPTPTVVRFDDGDVMPGLVQFTHGPSQ